MLNIGYRPTLNNGKDMSIEVHLIDFNDDIYYKEMKIEFVSRIRPEMKFEDINALTAQLNKDKAAIARLLASR